VVNELIILHNIQFVLVTNVRNAGDQTLLVRANSTQYFAL